MSTKLFKTSIALFFLLLFISGKAFGSHMLLHDHDAKIAECELCDKALVDQFSPLDFYAHQVDIPNTIEDVEHVVIYSAIKKVYTSIQFEVLFGRPPPTLS